MSTSSGIRARPSARPTARQLQQQRSAEATRALRDVLNLPTDLTDATILGTALAEAAVHEARRNPQFVRDIRRRYDEMAALRAANPPKPPKKAEALPPLVPINTNLGYYEADPFKPPDPGFLIRVYGYHQLGRALQDYTLDMLKQTAANVQAAHPGTKPKSKSSKAAVIDYIVEYSTNGR